MLLTAFHILVSLSLIKEEDRMSDFLIELDFSGLKNLNPSFWILTAAACESCSRQRDGTNAAVSMMDTSLEEPPG
jgi:secreted trypsin-like serine protease